MAESSGLDLWVRAGLDGIRNGSDPVCQQIFMVLLLKAKPQSSEEANSPLKFNVKTINISKPHAEFKALGLRHVPGVVLGEDIYEQPDEILEFVDSKYPEPSLEYSDPDAEAATRDLFSKFCFYIKEVNKDPKGLQGELQKLNAHILKSQRKFLTGDSLTHLDCRILPYLQHIRIAAEILKGYSIPKDFEGVWKYLKAGYETEAFRKSCPADQEIILYWAERKDTPNLSHTKIAELARQKPIFTWTVSE